MEGLVADWDRRMLQRQGGAGTVAWSDRSWRPSDCDDIVT